MNAGDPEHPDAAQRGRLGGRVTKVFGGNYFDRSFTIHTGYGARILRDGFLEEVLFHEGVHVSLQNHQDGAGWRSAQAADGEYISDYARDFPDREDVAESVLPYFTIRYRPTRLSATHRAAITDTIPNRLAYLDGLALDWSPYTPPASVMDREALEALYHATGGPNWTNRVRLFFVEEFLSYSWAFLPADASLQCSFRGDSNQASAYPRLSGGQPSLETVPNTVGLSPSGALPSGHSRGVLVRCRGKGGRPAMAVTTGFQRRTFDVPRTGVPCIDLPSRAPCAAADAVFADAKALLSSSEARQMSESELERELHRRRQDLVRKLLQGHRDQRSPKEAAGPAEDTSGVECSEPREHESHAETASGTMQVVGLGCARRGHDGLHRLDAALNLLPERYLVEMRRRVTIATASRAPPRTPWKPPWYSTSSTWQRRRGVRCSSSAHRRACRHLVRDPMGVDRRTVTLGCSCGGSQPPQAAGALMRTETSHEAREDQRKSPIGR